MSGTDRVYRVLVVDDNDGDLGLFQEALGTVRVPIVLVTRKDAQQALDLLATDRGFDLILSDLNMPNISGAEFVNRLEKKPELTHIPIVLMSSSLKARLPARIASAVTVPYFTKATTWPEFVHLAQEIEAMLVAGRSENSGRLLAERMTPATGFPKFTTPPPV
jgi:CheY-like chemotaxis protein